MRPAFKKRTLVTTSALALASSLVTVPVIAQEIEEIKVLGIRQRLEQADVLYQQKGKVRTPNRGEGNALLPEGSDCALSTELQIDNRCGIGIRLEQSRIMNAPVIQVSNFRKVAANEVTLGIEAL
jgi:hypothetical protein